ncbi:MAG TPA: cell division protein ZapA [Acidiferrobacteraceae bacterium]|nr:cell division protein ZapA [Acidiferrobacteraceae bacterium]
MRTTAGGVVISILGKDFTVACPPGERVALEAAAEHLDERMRGIQETGKVMGLDRCAVVAGLNLANELLELKRNPVVDARAAERLNKLRERVEQVLQE